MRWYLLRDRRHEGPYSKEQVIEGIKAGTIDPRDYLLPEQAERDQSSFAYISAADVVGPELLFDLKNKSDKAPAAQATVYAQDPITAVQTKESIISEFEDGLESTQLIRLRKERQPSDAVPAAEVFVSQPSGEGFKFPWAIASLVVAVLAIAGFVAQPYIESKPTVEAAGAVVSPARSPAAGSSTHSNGQNRVPTGRVQLPNTGIRDDEPTSAILRSRDEPVEKPIRKRRNKRPDSEQGEDSEVSAGSESFDEEQSVEEDESTEEDVDEADI